MPRKKTKRLVEMTDDELIDLYSMYLQQHAEAIKCRDKEGCSYSSVHINLLMPELKKRNMVFDPNSKRN